MNHKSAIGGAPAYIEQVGLAADLAVLDVLLVATGGFIHEGLVPLPTPRALIARISNTVLHREKFNAAFLNGKAASNNASSANRVGNPGKAPEKNGFGIDVLRRHAKFWQLTASAMI
jgi:hypothetical protein